MAMPQCCYLAKGAKRPSHTTNTMKFDRIPFDPCNSIKRFDLSPFDQKNSTYLQPPSIDYLNVGHMLCMHAHPHRRKDGKWSLGLMPFGLKSFGLIQLVTWLNFLKPSVSGIGHLA